MSGLQSLAALTTAKTLVTSESCLFLLGAGARDIGQSLDESHSETYRRWRGRSVFCTPADGGSERLPCRVTYKGSAPFVLSANTPSPLPQVLFPPYSCLMSPKVVVAEKRSSQ